MGGGEQEGWVWARGKWGFQGVFSGFPLSPGGGRGIPAGGIGVPWARDAAKCALGGIPCALGRKKCALGAIRGARDGKKWALGGVPWALGGVLRPRIAARWAGQGPAFWPCVGSRRRITIPAQPKNIMALNNYYPDSNDGRADWWTNVRDTEAQAALLAGGMTTAECSAIANDGLLGVYVYRGVRSPFDDLQKQIIAFAHLITAGASGDPVPTPPAVPSLPAIPDVAPVCGLEARRVQWVAHFKNLPLYTKPLGIAVGVEAASAPFVPADYKAVLAGLSSPAAKVVAGKFRKAYGQIDALNFYGRKAGTTDWTLLKTCMVSPFTAGVPLAGSAPEAWEFQGRAVVKDVEIGLPSDIVPVLIHG